MALVRDEGICLRRWDWSENSQTVAIFARTTGLVRAVAKGAKRENANFSGGLEVLTRGELVVSIRENKAADQLANLTAWDLLEVFPVARRRLDAFFAGLAILDVTYHALTDSDPHEAMYDGLVSALRELDHSPQGTRDEEELSPEYEAPPPPDVHAPLARYLWCVLSETGHAPELERDVRDQTPLAESEVVGFAPRLGGLVADGAVPGAWRVRSSTVAYLQDIARQRPTHADSDTTLRAVRLLGMYFREVFQVDVPALHRFLPPGERQSKRAQK